jgi:cystathionine gamma-synthase
MSKPRAPQTIAAANGIAADDGFGAVVPPVYFSSTFAFRGFERAGPHEYTRASNPNRDLLADTIARLESGVGAVMLASGMAAVDLVLSRLKPGELVIAPHDCYGGTYRLLGARRDRGQFEVSFVDEGDGAVLAAAIERNPR